MRVDGELEARLQREVLRSDALRARVLAAVTGGAGVLATTVLTAARWQGEPVSLLVTPIPFCTLSVVAVFELMASRRFARAAQTGNAPGAAARLVLTGIEACSLAMVVSLVGLASDPVAGLHGPPVMLFPALILLSVLSQQPWLSLATGLLVAAAYNGAGQVLLPHLDPESSLLGRRMAVLLRSFGMLALGGLAALVAREVRRRTRETVGEELERRRVLDLFGQQVSPEVVDKLLSRQAQDADTELRRVCVMFLDIRGFTQFSENRTPVEVVAYLNTLFDVLIAVVNEHKGIINKFLGDGFMAVFGAPVPDDQYTHSAVRASFDLLAEVERLVESGAIPATRIGIGLHQGEVMAGNVGSALRKEYTVIGDTVNTAARIEALNGRLGSQLLVSEAVRAAAPELLADATKEEPVAVKGKQAPVQVWRLR